MNLISQDSQQITAIKPAVKNPQRANIFLNQKYSFSLDLTQLVQFKLKVGQTLTPTQIATYQQASEFSKLYQRTLEWLLMRPRSIRETRDYLIKKQHRRRAANLLSVSHQPENRRPAKSSIRPIPEITDELIDQVIQRLIDKSYLDDLKFTNFYLENRLLKKGISQKRLKLELIKKGIVPSMIEQALAASSRNDSTEIAKIIIKKRSKYDDTKLLQYLVRQGFDYETSRNALRETDSQNSAQNL